MEEYAVRIRALTYIWTGDAEKKGGTLRETSILGSLRWWCEALVRGLGGYACDPTNTEKRCQLDQRKFKKALEEGKSEEEALDEQICPVCQLFGCGGWRRRFKIEIEGVSKGNFDKKGYKPNHEFTLRIITFQKLTEEQKWLLKKTLEMIENYGAIGGRTTWKPNGEWGTSYGLIKIEDYGGLESVEKPLGVVKKWLGEKKELLKREAKKDWFNFYFYWIVEGSYLNRGQINELVKRDRGYPRKYSFDATEFDKWLGGAIGVTKKIFSFAPFERGSFKSPAKVFGYVRDEEELKEIIKKLKEVLGEGIRVKTGKEILEGL